MSSQKTFRSEGDGIYYYKGGGFYNRPWVNGKRTWQRLKAETIEAAREEVERGSQATKKEGLKIRIKAGKEELTTQTNPKAGVKDAKKRFTSKGSGVYFYQKGGFYYRPWIDGKRTWQRLEAETFREAKEEVAQKAVSITNPQSTPAAPKNIRELIAQFLEAGCPNKRLELRSEKERARHKYLLQRPSQFFGDIPAPALRLSTVAKYGAWLAERIEKNSGRTGAGLRTADMELNALSNVYHWAVLMDHVPSNSLLGRTRFQRTVDVRHCWEVAPADGNELHAIARELFRHPNSETLAWQCLLEALSGCRTCEILRLRMDAATERHPGFINDGYLFINRAKKGTNPYAIIRPELKELIRAHKNWHDIRFPESPWWFPSHATDDAVNKTSLTFGLRRVCQRLGIGHRTSHGMRSYFVTCLRGMGIPDWQIAREIGDRTPELIPKTYGDRPDTYQGGNKHTWVPSQGAPAWHVWLPENCGILPMLEKTEARKTAYY